MFSTDEATQKLVFEKVGSMLKKYGEIKDNQILQGPGKLLSEKEKAWVKNHLRKEAVFLLKNYMSVLK